MYLDTRYTLTMYLDSDTRYNFANVSRYSTDSRYLNVSIDTILGPHKHDNYTPENVIAFQGLKTSRTVR